MASTTNLRSRRSAAQLHALAGVEREIRAQDSHSRRKYLREFNQAFRSYDSLLDSEQIQNALRSADVVLIGDYHALPAAQRYAASLLEQRALAGDRPVVLGVETIFARDQHILDEWWRREIDESELRQRIRFDLDWGYDWTPFYELLVTARDHAEALYGLDCMPREDLRKIGARDRHAAVKIAEIRERHPNAVIFVLFGESHLAPGHLPRALQRANAWRKNSYRFAERGRALLARCRRARRQGGSGSRQRRRAVRLQRHAAGEIRELPPVSRPVEPLRRWS